MSPQDRPTKWCAVVCQRVVQLQKGSSAVCAERLQPFWARPKDSVDWPLWHQTVPVQKSSIPGGNKLTTKNRIRRETGAGSQNWKPAYHISIHKQKSKSTGSRNRIQTFHTTQYPVTYFLQQSYTSQRHHDLSNSTIN